MSEFYTPMELKTADMAPIWATPDINMVKTVRHKVLLKHFLDFEARRGEQPDGQALPADRALSGDTPRSSTSESEVQ